MFESVPIFFQIVIAILIVAISIPVAVLAYIAIKKGRLYDRSDDPEERFPRIILWILAWVMIPEGLPRRPGGGADRHQSASRLLSY